jgi:hypothetical protein
VVLKTGQRSSILTTSNHENVKKYLDRDKGLITYAMDMTIKGERQMFSLHYLTVSSIHMIEQLTVQSSSAINSQGS